MRKTAQCDPRLISETRHPQRFVSTCSEGG